MTAKVKIKVNDLSWLDLRNPVPVSEISLLKNCDKNFCTTYLASSKNMGLMWS